jgi:ABC-type amino acid transport substrate-binding protein
MLKISRLGVIFSTLLFLSTLSGCFNKKVETITLLAAQDSPPYSFKDAHDGEIVGFEIELMKHISKKMGKTLQIKSAEFANVLADIEGSNADAAVGSISPTLERSKIYDFSLPYAFTRLVLISKKEKGISCVEDLFSKVLAVQSGSTCEEAARKISDHVFGVIVKPLQNNDVLIEELSTDGADALIMDILTAQHFCKENSALFVACPIAQDFLPSGSNSIAIMLPKDSTLREKINTTILEMQKDGSLEALEQLWLKNPHAKESHEEEKEQKSN